MNFAETWNSIPEKEGSPGAPEGREVADLKDGIYRVEVIGFRFFTAAKGGKSAGKQFYEFGLLVRQGLRKGAYVEKFSGATDIGLEILKKDIRRIVGRWASPEEVYNEEHNMTGSIRNEIVGAILDMQKGTSKPSSSGKTYPNYHFIKLVRAATGVGSADNGASDEKPPVHSDDDGWDDHDPARDAGEPVSLPDEPTGAFLEDPDDDDDEEGDEDIPF